MDPHEPLGRPVHRGVRRDEADIDIAANGGFGGVEALGAEPFEIDGVDQPQCAAIAGDIVDREEAAGIAAGQAERIVDLESLGIDAAREADREGRILVDILIGDRRRNGRRLVHVAERDRLRPGGAGEASVGSGDACRQAAAESFIIEVRLGPDFVPDEGEVGRMDTGEHEARHSSLRVDGGEKSRFARRPCSR